MPDPMYEVFYGWRYPEVWECGNVVVTDVGPQASHNRYIAHLGPLPLNEQIEKSYTLCELPNDHLFLGLSVDLGDANERGLEWEQLKDVVVSVRAVDSSGSVVFSHNGPLGGRWTLSGPYPDGAFLYGETELQPRPGEAYKLYVTVTPRTSVARIQARLNIRGGGWK